MAALIQVAAADARLAVENGIDGLIISNHGGRAEDDNRLSTFLSPTPQKEGIPFASIIARLLLDIDQVGAGESWNTTFGTRIRWKRSSFLDGNAGRLHYISQRTADATRQVGALAG
jgi:hypothetical protein